jgi:superfamily II DNA or RNA helicase
MTSAENLLPHQLALIEEYRSGSAPRVVALDAPPGSGKSYALAMIAAERAAAGGLVVVVLPSRLLVSQMTRLLSEAGASQVVVYATAADFRLAFDTDAAPWPETGLVICSSSVIKSPLATKALATTTPSLLILDDVAESRRPDLKRWLQALANRSRHVIFTGRSANAGFTASETRRWTFPLMDSGGQLLRPEFSVRVHEYGGNLAEAQLVREAIELLNQLPPALPRNFFTRPAIQFALLDRVRRLANPEEFTPQETERDELESEGALSQVPDRGTIETIWRMLDRFDDLPPDTRLIAANEETRSAFDQGRAVVIVTGSAQEADYLSAAIWSRELPITAVTSRTQPAQRLSAMEDLRNGRVLVVTDSFFTAMQMPLPDGTLSLWFRPPSTRRQIQRRLGLGMSSRGVEIVLFRAVPPVTPADELVERLKEMLRDPWQEPELMEEQS